METLPMREEDGKLYAPGIGDDTSNLVNLLLSAKYLLQNGTDMSCGVLIVANACEEGLGSRPSTPSTATRPSAPIPPWAPTATGCPAKPWVATPM